MLKKIIFTLALPLTLTLTTTHVRADTSAVDAKIATTTTKIAELQSDMNDLSEKLVDTKSNMAELSKMIANQARSAQTDTNISFIDTLLSSTSITDFIQKSTAMNTIAEQNDQLLTDYKDRQKELNKLIDKSKNKSAEYEMLLNSLGDEKEAILKREAEEEKARLAKEAEEKAIKEKAEQKTKDEAVSKAATERANTSSTAASKQNTAPAASVSKTGSTGGLDLSQTSGYVDIQTLANYMATVTPGDAGTWYHIIYHESRGLINAQNSSSTAYGAFQCLTAVPGSTLGQQIDLAIYYYYNQGFYNAWLRWEP